MAGKEISVVVPCFNEGKTIYKNIKKIHAYLKSNFEFFEIIAVNDGSTDNTLSELRAAQQEIPFGIINKTQNEGKGKAVRDGIARSRNGIVMFLDADLAIPVEELQKFLAEIKTGSDIVIASRFVPGLKILKSALWHRKLMERAFRLLRKMILSNWKIQDTQCGFKVFRREAARRIFAATTINRFAFDAEIIFIAKKFGYTLKEMPIRLQNSEISSVRIFRDSVNMLFSLCKIRYNDLSGKYSRKERQ